MFGGTLKRQNDILLNFTAMESIKYFELVVNFIKSEFQF